MGKVSAIGHWAQRDRCGSTAVSEDAMPRTKQQRVSAYLCHLPYDDDVTSQEGWARCTRKGSPVLIFHSVTNFGKEHYVLLTLA